MRSRARVLLCSLGVCAVVVSASFVPYLTESDESLASKAVSWARDHGLGTLITRLERMVSDQPPSSVPASRLSLNERVEDVRPSLRTPDLPSGDDARFLPPTPLTPVVVPALPGEGVWRTVAVAGGAPALWATSLRPLPAFPSVTATYVAFEQENLRAALFNGSRLPGGKWRLQSSVPEELRTALVAAFNGGFRFEHAPGSGYVTEGRTVREPSEGLATLVVTPDRRLRLGVWGDDLAPNAPYLSVRQNLRPLVVDGVSQGSRAAEWGLDSGGIRYVPRSAVCSLVDGRLLYVLVHDVDAKLLGDVLVAAGCRLAAQLDINGSWPSVYVFSSGKPELLDAGTGAPRNRYLNGSTKEFFAFFDESLLVEGLLPD
jgi:hypothetical protein